MLLLIKKKLELNSNIIGNNNNVNSNFTLRKGIDLRQNNNNLGKDNANNLYYNIGRTYTGNNLNNSNSQRYITSGNIKYNFHF